MWCCLLILKRQSCLTILAKYEWVRRWRLRVLMQESISWYKVFLSMLCIQYSYLNKRHLLTNKSPSANIYPTERGLVESQLIADEKLSHFCTWVQHKGIKNHLITPSSVIFLYISELLAVCKQKIGNVTSLVFSDSVSWWMYYANYVKYTRPRFIPAYYCSF